MPSIVACPACAGKLRVPDDLLGQSVRCPSCRHTFAASAPRLPPPEMPAVAPAPGHFLDLSLDAPPSASGGRNGAVEIKLPLDDETPSAPPPPRTEEPPALRRPPRRDEEEECPHCGETNRAGAGRCGHCGERFDDEDWPDRPYRGIVRRDSEPHRGGLVLALGIISLVALAFCGLVGLPLGIAAWIMGRSDLRKMRGGDMDPDGQGITQAGWICGIIGTVLNSLYSLLCVGWFGMIFYSVSRVPPPPPTPVPVQKFEVPKQPPPPPQPQPPQLPPQPPPRKRF